MKVKFTFRRNFSWPIAGEWKTTHTIVRPVESEAEVKIEVCRLQSQLPPYVLVEASEQLAASLDAC
jgi:hypothetical protein